ncbi:MAG TPA: type II toxin-antitoxin system VapC family toxin [Pirellulales bacterium]|jgi:predicted nucleic acid-binding protein|nr:type II toxin-antitoxin system VapC family toxin [Pirellulales bacterium]
MIKPLVYVETTIPSFYCETRTSADVVARMQWTQQWWKTAADRFELCSSAAVLDELGGGELPERNALRLNLMKHVPLVPITDAIGEIVQAYLHHHLMPTDPAGDALHLALASYHRCDFLVTWNCRHLANANKFGHIRRVNTILGLWIPAIVTPLELLENEP